MIHRHTPHTHIIHDERFGLELSARHSRSALRHSNQVIVQSVKVFLHVRQECTAVPQNPVFTCSICGVQLLQKISPFGVFNEPHVMQAVSFCLLGELCPFPHRLRRPLRFWARLACGRNSRGVGSQHAKRQSHWRYVQPLHSSTPLSLGRSVRLCGRRTEVTGVCLGCLKKTLNASRPSEHPLVRGGNVKTFVYCCC